MSENFEDNMRPVRLSRADLQQFLKDPKVIKQFENLVYNLQNLVPPAIDEGNAIALDAQTSAAFAQEAANTARGLSDKLTMITRDLVALQGVQRAPGGDIQRLVQRVEAMESTLLALTRANCTFQLAQRVAYLEGMLLTLTRNNTDALRKQIDELRSLVLGA